MAWCQVSLHACILESKWNPGVANCGLLVSVFLYSWCCSLGGGVWYWYVSLFLEGRWEMSRVTLRIAWVHLVLELSVVPAYRGYCHHRLCVLTVYLAHTQHALRPPDRSSTSASGPLSSLLYVHTPQGLCQPVSSWDDSNPHCVLVLDLFIFKCFRWCYCNIKERISFIIPLT